MARKISDKHQARFLKVDDLNGRPLSLTVTQVTDEEIGEDKKDMYVAYFKETLKGLPLNKTNGDTIAEFLETEDVDEWPGAIITLMPAKTEFGGKRVPCIRIKAARFSKGSTAAATDAPMHELEDDDGDPEAVL